MNRALLIVDVQPDFLPGGPLGCPGGFAVIPRVISQAAVGDYDSVIATGDAHPRHSPHFKKWPRHCVAGTPGATMLLAPLADTVIDKGRGSEDGYSAFDGLTVGSFPLPLINVLRMKQVTHIDVVGIAYNYCVRDSALDSARWGFKTRVLRYATASVPDGTEDEATKVLQAAGVEIRS